MKKISLMLAVCCVTHVVATDQNDRPPNVSQRVKAIHKGAFDKAERNSFRTGKAWVPVHPQKGGRFEGFAGHDNLESSLNTGKKPKTAVPCGKITGNERYLPHTSTQRERDAFNPKPITGVERSHVLQASRPLAEKVTGNYVAPQSRKLTEKITCPDGCIKYQHTQRLEESGIH